MNPPSGCSSRAGDPNENKRTEYCQCQTQWHASHTHDSPFCCLQFIWFGAASVEKLVLGVAVMEPGLATS